MPLIKRYPNRKLYDTEARRYVTLDAIAGLVRGGHEVTVVDHATGEDVTTVTMAQILLDETRRHDSLPRAVLADLVRSGEQTLAALRRGLDLPLSAARQVDDEIERRLRALVGRGELGTEEVLRLREKLLGGSPAHDQDLDEARIQAALEAYDLPTRGDVQRLLDQIDEVTGRVDDALADPNRPEP